MRDCCAESANLRLRPPDPSHPERVVRVCIVCGARHIDVSIDPAAFGVVVKP
jgi:hypothetical protein